MIFDFRRLVVEFLYALCRALVSAKSAPYALRIVDMRKIVHHFDCALWTILCAKSATEASHFAECFDVFCPSQAVGASNVDFRVRRYAFDKRFRTSGDALSASDTSFFVHDGKAVHAHFNCVRRARIRARAHSETTPRTLFSAACKKFHTATVAVAHIFVFVHGVVCRFGPIILAPNQTSPSNAWVFFMLCAKL